MGHRRHAWAIGYSVALVAALCFSPFAGASSRGATPPGGERPSDLPTVSAETRKMFEGPDLGSLASAYLEKNADTLGGIEFHDNNSVAVYVTDASDVKKVKEVLGTTKKVRIVKVKRTYAQLLKIQEQILDLISSGQMPDAVGTSIDSENSAVKVLTDTGKRPLSYDLGAFGDALTFGYSPRPEPAIGRQNDQAPFFGGAEIRHRISSTTYAACSAGLAIRSASNTQYMLTAGHCGPTGWSWTNGSENATLGTMQYLQYGNNGYDSGLIAGGAMAGYIYNGSPTSTSSIKVSRIWDMQNAGEVYTGGSRSGQIMGYRAGGQPSSGQCLTDTTGKVSCGLLRIDQKSGWAPPCKSGDSGGPVYVYPGDGTVAAIGLIHGISGTSCYYTKIQPIMSIWNATLAP